MVKQTLKTLYYQSLLVLQADKFRWQKIRRNNQLVILNLHRISPANNPFWSPLHPQLFEELLSFLQKKFEVCLFREIEEREKSSKPLAILSFDDGYRDFIEYAVPLLDKYKLKANINIIPRCVDSQKPLWNIQLYDFLNVAPRNLVNDIKLPDFSVKLKDDSQEAKLRFGLQISRYLKNRPREERDRLWQFIQPYLDKLDFPKTAMMSVDDIREISKIHEVGGHSFSHESMKFESDEFFRQDLINCKNFFEQSLDLPLTIYAFPNGSYKMEQIEILRENQIKHILLVDEKFAELHSDVYPRLTFYADSKAQVRLKALGF